MKKLLAILLCLTTVFSLAACAEEDEDSSSRRRKSKKEKENQFEILENEEAPDNYEEDTDFFVEEELSSEPTEEEYEFLNEYLRICETLHYYDGKYISAEIESGRYVQGSAALEFYYQRLYQLKPVVDRWLNTEYVCDLDYYNDQIPNDLQTILNGFYFVDDVKLSYVCTESADNLGNVEHEDDGLFQNTSWEYDAQRQETRAKNTNLLLTPFQYFTSDYRFETEYDDAGRISCKRYFYDNNEIAFLMVYNYNEQGQLISIEQRHNTSSKFFDFSYDENGRLSQVRWENVFDYTIDYTYDEQGRVIQESWGEWGTNSSFLNPEDNFDYLMTQKVHEYTYNEQGHLATGTFTKHDYYSHGEKISTTQTDTVRYTVDEQGRVLEEDITFGPKISYPGTDMETSTPNSISARTYEYRYGTYCQYIPAN